MLGKKGCLLKALSIATGWMKLAPAMATPPWPCTPWVYMVMGCLCKAGWTNPLWIFGHSICLAAKLSQLWGYLFAASIPEWLHQIQFKQSVKFCCRVLIAWTKAFTPQPDMMAHPGWSMMPTENFGQVQLCLGRQPSSKFDLIGIGIVNILGQANGMKRKVAAGCAKPLQTIGGKWARVWLG